MVSSSSHASLGTANEHPICLPKAPFRNIRNVLLLSSLITSSRKLKSKAVQRSSREIDRRKNITLMNILPQFNFDGQDV